jgi:hypothetical protein
MTMTNEQTIMLVFKDRAGDYFLLPPDVLERGRVPTEHKVDIERVVAEMQGDDTSGHAAFLAGFVVGAGLMGAGMLGAAVAVDAYNDYTTGTLGGRIVKPNVKP